MLNLTVLLLFAFCYAISYPPYQAIVKEMDDYVFQCQGMNIPGITAHRVVMGTSTEGKEIFAFCFGNCADGPFSVTVLCMCNCIVSSDGRNPWTRGTFCRYLPTHCISSNDPPSGKRCMDLTHSIRYNGMGDSVSQSGHT